MFSMSIVETPSLPLIKRGCRTFKKLSHLGGVPKILLERVDNPEKGGRRGLPLFYYFNVQLHLLCLRGKSFLYYILVHQSFELTMQDSHPSLFSIKIFYHLYISDPF